MRLIAALAARLVGRFAQSPCAGAGETRKPGRALPSPPQIQYPTGCSPPTRVC
jgi:hypothetical protein